MKKTNIFLRAAAIALVGAAIQSAKAAASSEGLATVTFPQVSADWVWDNDLDGKALGTATLEEGAKMTVYNGSVDTLVVGVDAVLNVTGSACTIGTLTVSQGAVATVDNADKANITTINAVAGVVDGDVTSYYADWATVLAAASAPSATPKTIELRASFDDATMGAVTLLAVNDKIVIDNSYVQTAYSDAHVALQDSVWQKALKTVEGNVATYIAKYDLSLAEVATVDDQVYTGRAITPEPAVTFNGNALGTDAFGYEYANNVEKTTEETKATVRVAELEGSDYHYFATALAQNFEIVGSDADHPAELHLPDVALVPGDDPENPKDIEDILEEYGDDAVVKIVLDEDMTDTIVVPENVAKIIIDLAGNTLSPEAGQTDAIVAVNPNKDQTIEVVDTGRAPTAEEIAASGGALDENSTVYGKVDGNISTDAGDALALNDVDVDGTVDADGTVSITGGSDIAAIDGDGTFTVNNAEDPDGEGITCIRDITGIADTAKLVSGDKATVEGVTTGILLKDGNGVVTSDTTLKYVESRDGEGNLTSVSYIYRNQGEVVKITHILNPVLTEGKIKVKAGL